MSRTFRISTELASEAVQLRRTFHANPELAFEEVETAHVVAEHLRASGYSVRTGIGKTGVIGVLDTGRAGKTVLARADFDALPIHEETGLAFASGHPGKMHACGHDAHAAILLITAKALAERQDELNGKIVVVFQPAEEIGAGAKAMLNDNALDGIAPDHVIGLHITSLHELGTLHVSAGPTMAATDTVEITVRGVGGHAAMPPHFIDPVVAAAQLITALQTVVSRETDPLDQSVLSFGMINGGSVSNVIPEEVYLAGTLRTFSEETRSRLKARIEEITRHMLGGFRCEASVKFTEGTDAVVNDLEAVQHFAGIAAAQLGAENVREQTPMMGGDDMALWLQQAPGAYFWLGAQSGESTSYAHHHPKFDIDEAAIPTGVELLTATISDLLA